MKPSLIGFLILINFFSCNLLFSQEDISIFSVRSESLGNTDGISSSWTNASLLSYNKRTSLYLYYYDRYSLKEISPFGIAFSSHLKDFYTSVALIRLGSSEYVQNGLNLSFSHQLSSKLFFGISIEALNSIYKKIDLNAFRISFSPSIFYRFSDILSCSFIVDKLSNYDFNDVDKSINFFSIHRLILGFNWLYEDNLSFFIQVDKYVNTLWKIGIGIEYRFEDLLAFRLGYNTYSSMPSFGIGFKKRLFELDYGTIYHRHLGLCHIIGLSFHF